MEGGKELFLFDGQTQKGVDELRSGLGGVKALRGALESDSAHVSS